MEPDVRRSTAAEARIHRAEKEIGPVAETDFGIWIAPRDAGKATYIWHRYRFASYRGI